MSALPRIFVISLARSQDRRARIAQDLADLGLGFEFVDGVDGAALDPASLPSYHRSLRRLCFGRDLTHGELGCLLSHRAVFERIARENIPAALILEDDARAAPALPAVLRRLMEMERKWDIVRFLASEKVYAQSRFIENLDAAHALIRPLGTPGGAYATLVNAKAARALRARMERNWMPNDIVLGHVWKDGAEVLAVRPSPVRADMEIESTIGDARFVKAVDLPLWQAAAYPFTRALFKLYDNGGRALYRALSALRDRR